MPIPVGSPDLPKVRVDSLNRLARRRDREDKVGIDSFHQRRRHLIAVIDRVGQVHTRRSYVAYSESHVPGELALNIHVPLHLIGTTGIEFNMRALDRSKG